MAFPDYSELPERTDGVDDNLAADINAAYDAIKEIATRTYGGPSAYDALITVDGDYTAYDATGAVIATNASLPTVWAAVDDANTHVHFAAGSFTTSSTLALAAGMTVTGEGASKTLITKSGSGHLFSATGADGDNLITNIEIAHLGMSGPSVSGTQVVGSGVFFDFYENVEVHHCEISGFGSDGDNAGIEADRGFDAHFWANILHDNKNGICTGSPSSTTIRSERVLIDGNFCYGNYDDGIHGQRSKYITITNNYCWGNANGGASDGAGIDALGDEYDTISGNVCFGNARGIEIGNTANASYPDIGHTVSGNICHSNSEYGMTVIAAAVRCTITGNTIEGNTTNGIRFGTATGGQEVIDVVIDGNQIHNNGTKGIDLFGYNTRPILRNNTMSGHSTCDIHVRTSTGTPSEVALLDNKTMSTTGIDDDVAGGGFVTRLFGGHIYTADSILPSQSGNSGKVLKTNGTTASWQDDATGGGGGGGAFVTAVPMLPADVQESTRQAVFITPSSGLLAASVVSVGGVSITPGPARGIEIGQAGEGTWFDATLGSDSPIPSLEESPYSWPIGSSEMSSGAVIYVDNIWLNTGLDFPFPDDCLLVLTFTPD